MDWYKHKGYPHIGIPPTNFKELNRLKAYITNSKSIEKHPFVPFIHNIFKSRRYRRKIYDDGSRSTKREIKSKERHIYYANNADANIYAYYSHILSAKYENLLVQSGIEKVPTAYRTIPLEDGSRNKCNIDFADETFNYIRDSKHQKLCAIAMDITSFFDNLDHKLLKEFWLSLLNSEGGVQYNRLPKDHYNVFRNITKFSYVNENEIFNEFQDEIFIKKGGSIVKKRVDKKQFLYNQKAVAFCSIEDVARLRSKNYIKSNKRDFATKKLRKKGIPQGSPISAMLANLYLLQFDVVINRYVTSIGGMYRRYSDDLVCIVPCKYEKQILKLVQKEILKYKLEIQPKKTQVFWFIRCAERFYGFEKNGITNQFQTNTFFEYLGFSFDGKTTRLKSASLATFYRKMKRSIKRGYFYSRSTEALDKRGKLFKGRLYKRFTYKGASRRRKYQRVKGTTNEWEVSKRYDWGNYLSYAYMAARVMRENKIKNQVKRHWIKFHDLL